MFVQKSQTVLVILLALVAFALFAARPTNGAGHEERYVVQPGDTLWALVVDLSGGDPHETIWQIKERNGLEQSTVQPGQVLYILR